MFNDTHPGGNPPVRTLRNPRGIRIRARLTFATVMAAVVGSSMLAGCGSIFDTNTVVVNVGYQSKTINTINAGTLMRDRGEFEAALERAGAASGTRYRVVWQDFSSGAPLTAAMIASHVDIGSMGDYPLLTNGSKTARFDDAATEFIATTGYNMRGSLNQVVVPTRSEATTLGDLTGRHVSTSLGSAGDGMLSTALLRGDIDRDEVNIANQDPSIGAAAIEGHQVDGLAQFVPWPQLVIFRNQGRLLYDGGDNNVPTFHGIVVRKQFSAQRPEVIAAFMEAMKVTTDYIVDNPLAAALRVSEITGIEPEVTYLYNGPGGLVSFDQTIKPEFIEALAGVKEFLVGRGSVSADFDIADFSNEEYLRDLFGPELEQRTNDVSNPSRITGFDEICELPVEDPTTASEVWFVGSQTLDVAATPTCLLRRIADSGDEVRVSYVPDARTGAKLFADHATWVSAVDATGARQYLPFATRAAAEDYLAEHSEAEAIDYGAAVQASRPVT